MDVHVRGEMTPRPVPPVENRMPLTSARFGIALGAASYVAVQKGQAIKPFASAALGPSYTKQEVRAATLAKLMPMRGALLWDIGCGSGSVAIEWMRAARYARAIGIEPRDDRRAMAAANALALGAPKLTLVEGQAPSPEGTHVCPTVWGAANWMSDSYDPVTGWHYVMTMEASASKH